MELTTAVENLCVCNQTHENKHAVCGISDLYYICSCIERAEYFTKNCFYIPWHVLENVRIYDGV